MPSFDPVVAVGRGIEILRVVNELSEATISQIHEKTGIHQSTILRMLETLIHNGYVVRRVERASYIPTGKCLQLSNGLRKLSRLLEIATPTVSSCQKSIGWPVDMAVFDNDAMVTIATDRKFGAMSLNRTIGDRLPLLGSSLGRAYLAFCSEDEQDAILKRLANSKTTWDRKAKNRRRLLKDLNEIRANGYATGDVDYRIEVYDGALGGLAVPVLTGQKVAASIGVTFLNESMSIDEGVTRYFKRLQQAADEIASAIVAEFGYFSPV
jgi:IclR family mhp operon transcriptional activator